MAFAVIFYILALYAAHIACVEAKRQNIVFITADDLGFNDVSLRGSDQILTKNIDMLAYRGVILDNYYTDSYGTAAASAMFTGKYPMKLGTQGPSIGAAEDRGVPLSERLLPSYLKDLGYATHFVGRWSLGKSRRCYLPMKRDFDTFYGCTSSVDYYTYNHMETYNGTDYFGTDLYDGFEPVVDQRGHLTNILNERAINIIKDHDPSVPLYLHFAHVAPHSGGALVNLQAPGEDVAANSHIAHSPRRYYAALVSNMDESVGSIVKCLAEYNMLNDTIIIFVSDNGASSVGISRNYGCNLPFRGTKGSPWDGGCKTTGIVWKADMNSKIHKGLMHVVDWLPTLLAAVGGAVPTDIDGINQWDSIAYDAKPKRNQVVVAIDDLNKWGAYRDGDLKLIIGNVPNTCGYYGSELSKLIYKAPDYVKSLLSSKTFKVFTEYFNMDFNISEAMEKRDLCNMYKRKSSSDNTTLETRKICVPTYERGCLFNITADPEESLDLWDQYPEIVQSLVLRLRLLWLDVVPRTSPVFDLRADPINNSYVWLPWLEDDDNWPPIAENKAECPIKLTIEQVRHFIKLNNDVLQLKISNFLDNAVDYYRDTMELLV